MGRRQPLAPRRPPADGRNAARISGIIKHYWKSAAALSSGPEKRQRAVATAAAATAAGPEAGRQLTAAADDNAV